MVRLRFRSIVVFAANCSAARVTYSMVVRSYFSKIRSRVCLELLKQWHIFPRNFDFGENFVKKNIRRAIILSHSAWPVILRKNAVKKSDLPIALKI